MKRIVVRLSGMPFDPTYEIDDDTVAIGDLVRVPGSNSAFIEDGETGTVIALESSYTGPCKRATRVSDRVPAPLTHRIHFSREPTARRAKLISWSRYVPSDPPAVWPGSGRCDTSRRAAWRRGLDGWIV